MIMWVASIRGKLSARVHRYVLDRGTLLGAMAVEMDSEWVFGMASYPLE